MQLLRRHESRMKEQIVGNHPPMNQLRSRLHGRTLKLLGPLGLTRSRIGSGSGSGKGTGGVADNDGCTNSENTNYTQQARH